MKNYKDSDYALNKVNKDAIVYRFADETVEVTLSDYLAENPGKTEADFCALKELSDADYLERDRKDNAQNKRNISFDELSETELCTAPSPEELLIGKIDAIEAVQRKRERLSAVIQALDTLTEVQRRRYLLHIAEGLTTREIAAKEGIDQRSVMDSLEGAKRKIKKFLKTSENE